jgi:hypothetical protein
MSIRKKIESNLENMSIEQVWVDPIDSNFIFVELKMLVKNYKTKTLGVTIRIPVAAFETPICGGTLLLQAVNLLCLK